MNVAILNLPLDDNYGGHLQRYAMVTTLKKMGHSPSHISLRKNFKIPAWKLPVLLLLRAYRKYIKHQPVEIFYEFKEEDGYLRKLSKNHTFYETYIPHTHPVYTKKDLERLPAFDAYIVGSDQVWRKSYTGKMLETYYFGFIKQSSPFLIAYAVSFGRDDNEYTEEDIKKLKPLYTRFKSVSVREKSGASILKSVGFDNPPPIIVLDPTFLLTKTEYNDLIGDTAPLNDSKYVFCYILDKTEAIEKEIERVQKEMDLKVVYCSIKESRLTIQEWLKGIAMSEHVITDSYHGLVFSIIFNKPFSLFKNENRGKTRFDSVLDIFNLGMVNEIYDWEVVNKTIQRKRVEGMDFIKENLTK